MFYSLFSTFDSRLELRKPSDFLVSRRFQVKTAYIRFAKGELDDATSCWMQALEALPPTRKGYLGLLEAATPEDGTEILAKTPVFGPFLA